MKAISFLTLGKKAGFIAITLFILLVIVEIALSAGFWARDRFFSALVRVPDTIDSPYTYYAYRPNPANDTNPDGLYTRAAREKDSRKFRIILVGGSVVRSQAYGTFEQTISAQLERELNARLQTDQIEIINAGVSAFVVEQEFILTQLVLQYYQPDMIVSLDGYNDALSFHLNGGEYAYAPHNWRDFHVIERGREDRQFVSRFTPLFRSTLRAAGGVERFIERTRSDNEANPEHDNDELERAARLYTNVLRDMRDFCTAKRIAFHSFLQPVKWYDPHAESPARLNAPPRLPALYARYDDWFEANDWARTLTGVFEGRINEVYRDDVHVTAEGNRLFAHSMADFLAPRLMRADDGRIINAP